MGKDVSELPDVPSRRSLTFYVVLLLLVLPLWGSVPFAWAFVIYTLRSGRVWYLSWSHICLFFIAFSEVLFSIYHLHLVKQVSRRTSVPPGNLSELQAAFQRVLKAGLANLPPDGYDQETLDDERPGSPAEIIVQLEHDDHRAIDFRNVLRTWFGRAEWSTIRLHEVRQWLYWSIYNKDLPPLDTLPHAHRAALDETLDLLQKRLGKRIPEGSSPKSKPMRVTLDDVKVYWRPLTFYAVVAVTNLCIKTWYQRRWQFRHGSLDGLEYLLRIPSHWDPARDPRPLVFVHGLGLGLLQYSALITYLAESLDDRPLLILLQPHISQNIFHSRYLMPMSRRETVQRLAKLMSALGWVDLPDYADIMAGVKENQAEQVMVDKPRKGVTLMSHSNGSYCHAWILKDCPHMITRSCFVDPVTFCSWEGDVCHNFLYKICTNGTELLVRYFVGTELGVANLLRRHFDWSSNALWYEEIPNARDSSRTLFLLGGKDSIVNASRVKLYLQCHGVRKGLWYDPDGRHGQALLAGGRGRKVVLDWLRTPVL